jgi:hypothetical protein
MTTVFPGPGVRNRERKGKRVPDPVAARAAAGRSPKESAAINARPVADADWNGLFTIGILG